MTETKENDRGKYFLGHFGPYHLEGNKIMAGSVAIATVECPHDKELFGCPACGTSHLLAASWDLIDVLMRIQRLDTGDEPFARKHAELFDQARAAISKAFGRNLWE